MKKLSSGTIDVTVLADGPSLHRLKRSHRVSELDYREIPSAIGAQITELYDLDSDRIKLISRLYTPGDIGNEGSKKFQEILSPVWEVLLVPLKLCTYHRLADNERYRSINAVLGFACAKIAQRATKTSAKEICVILSESAEFLLMADWIRKSGGLAELAWFKGCVNYAIKDTAGQYGTRIVELSPSSLVLTHRKVFPEM